MQLKKQLLQVLHNKTFHTLSSNSYTSGSSNTLHKPYDKHISLTKQGSFETPLTHNSNFCIFAQIVLCPQARHIPTQPPTVSPVIWMGISDMNQPKKKNFAIYCTETGPISYRYLRQFCLIQWSVTGVGDIYLFAEIPVLFHCSERMAICKCSLIQTITSEPIE